MTVKHEAGGVVHWRFGFRDTAHAFLGQAWGSVCGGCYDVPGAPFASDDARRCKTCERILALREAREAAA